MKFDYESGYIHGVWSELKDKSLDQHDSGLNLNNLLSAIQR